MRRPRTVLRLVAFQLGISGIQEIHEKMRSYHKGIDPAGPYFSSRNESEVISEGFSRVLSWDPTGVSHPTIAKD